MALPRCGPKSYPCARPQPFRGPHPRWVARGSAPPFVPAPRTYGPLPRAHDVARREGNGMKRRRDEIDEILRFVQEHPESYASLAVCRRALAGGVERVTGETRLQLEQYLHEAPDDEIGADDTTDARGASRR